MNIENDKTILLLIEAAKRYKLDKLVLFGSRAKNTEKNNSDYDLLAYGDNYYDFYCYVEDDMPTLELFDIYDGNNIGHTFNDEIIRTGIVLYEKT